MVTLQSLAEKPGVYVKPSGDIYCTCSTCGESLPYTAFLYPMPESSASLRFWIICSSCRQATKGKFTSKANKALKLRGEEFYLPLLEFMPAPFFTAREREVYNQDRDLRSLMYIALVRANYTCEVCGKPACTAGKLYEGVGAENRIRLAALCGVQGCVTSSLPILEGLASTLNPDFTRTARGSVKANCQNKETFSVVPATSVKDGDIVRDNQKLPAGLRRCAYCSRAKSEADFRHTICHLCFTYSSLLRHRGSISFGGVTQKVPNYDRTWLDNLVARGSEVLNLPGAVDQDLFAGIHKKSLFYTVSLGEQGWVWEVTSKTLALKLLSEGFGFVLRDKPNVIILWFSQNYIIFRRQILARDHNTCHFCSQPADTVDHLIPLSKLGLTTPKNCVAACFRCNQLKGDKTPKQFKKFLYQQRQTSTSNSLV